MKADGKSGILVLDVDEIHAKTVAQKLNQHGILAEYTSVPEDALERCRTTDKYSILLSEIWLPGTTGFEIAQTLREEKIASPEIILMSSDSKISLFECHQSGACYFIRKPINLDELGLALKRFGGISTLSGNEPTVDSVSAMGRLYGQIRVSKKKQELPVEVSNLGRGGFFCKTLHGMTPPPVGQVVDFNIKLGMVPNCEAQGRGIIRWSYQTMMGDAGVGIEFLKVPEWFQGVAHSFADLFKVKSYIPNS